MRATPCQTPLCDALAVCRGVTALVGAGGKTTLMHRLGQELSARGRVLLCTTTLIYPPACPTLLSPAPDELERAFALHSLVAVGSLQEGGKMGPAAGPMDSLFALADYVIAEADGARGFPLKAPAGHEPVLPAQTALVVAVAGMDGVGLPIFKAAHRPELYAQILRKDIGDIVTPADAARVLGHPDGQKKAVNCRFMAVLNKADNPRRLAAARDCARALGGEVCITALLRRPIFVERWRDSVCLSS